MAYDDSVLGGCLLQNELQGGSRGSDRAHVVFKRGPSGSKMVPVVSPEGPKTSPREPKEVLNGQRHGQLISEDATRRATVEKTKSLKQLCFISFSNSYDWSGTSFSQRKRTRDAQNKRYLSTV